MKSLNQGSLSPSTSEIQNRSTAHTAMLLSLYMKLKEIQNMQNRFNILLNIIILLNCYHEICLD
jgi:hypothetical protein